ncbi:MAG: carboxypeptidase-like regulatory domain-containing protein [Planctomycetota bacterium]
MREGERGPGSWLAVAAVLLAVAAVTFVVRERSEGTDRIESDLSPSATSTTTTARRERYRAPADRTDLPRAGESSDETAPSDGETPGEELPPRVLRGRVLRPDGSAAAAATVELFPIGSSRGVGARAKKSTRTTAEGTFELPSPGGADLVLVAREAPWRPASRPLADLPEGEDLILRLEPCLELRGTVTYRGRPLTPASIFADAAFGTPGLFGSGAEMFWRDGRPEAKHGSASVSEEGTFRITGLGPGRHDVHVRPSVDGMDFNLLQPLTRIVAEVPDADLRIELDAAECTVTLLRDGVPADDVGLEISSDGRPLMSRLGPLEVARRPVIVLMPDESYTLVPRHPEVEAEPITFRAPAKGERRDLEIHLTKIERPYLELEFLGDVQPRTAEFELELLPLDPAPRDLRAPSRLKTTAARAEDGIIRSERIATEGGLHSLRVLPLRSGDDRYLHIEDVEVLLPPAGLVRVALRASEGGRIEPDYEWSDADGDAHLSWRLTRMTGHVVSRVSVNASRNGGNMRVICSTAGFPVAGKHRQNEVLPPGRYRLEIDRGGENRELRVLEIRPRETARPAIPIHAR